MVATQQSFIHMYNITYNKICGKVKGYQKGCVVAFWGNADFNTKSINNIYVSGISITHGNIRKHVWTNAAGVSDD